MKNKKNPKLILEKRTAKHTLVGLVIALAITLAAFEWRVQKEYHPNTGSDLVIDEIIEVDIIPITRKKVQKPTPVKVEKKKSNNIKAVEKRTMKIVGRLLELKSLDELGLESFDDPTEFENITEAPLPKIYNSGQVEVMPSFKCSDNSYSEIMNYLTRSIKYPAKAKREGKQGVVYVSFVVNKRGSVEQVKVVSDKLIGGGCEEEAVRVIRNMPDWCPGKQYNKPVSVRYNLPIKFALRG